MTGFSRKLHLKKHNNSTIFSDVLDLIGAMIKPALESTLSDAADVAGRVNTRALHVLGFRTALALRPASRPRVTS